MLWLFGDNVTWLQAWMETSSGQEMLEEAKKRKPDELEIRINIQAPRLYFPVRGKARDHGLAKLRFESHSLCRKRSCSDVNVEKNTCSQLYSGAATVKNRKLPMLLLVNYDWIRNCEEVTSLQKTTMS